MNYHKNVLLILFMLCLIVPFTYGQSQKKEITGKIIDELGETVIGASILVKGTATGTTTDMNGQFKLQVSEGQILQINYIGYAILEVPVGRNNHYSITLKEDAQLLGEVIVVGYGSQKKESVVGAISQIKGDDLMKAGVPSISNSLTGRIPGLVTIQSTGLPGSSEAELLIRGVSSFTGSNGPLVLVDGVERSMNDIDPSEVESISVLKDASATAVFGVKGANGVVLVTTKRGQEGKMEVSIKIDQTFKQPTMTRNLAGSYETLYDRNKMYRNRMEYEKVISDDILEHYRTQDMPYIYPDVDLLDMMLRDFGLETQASVSARGGTQFAKYFGSIGFLNEGDMLKGTQKQYDPSYKYERFNFRLNFDFDFTKSTRVSVSTGGFVGKDQHSTLERMMRAIMFQTPYDHPIIYPASLLEEYPDPLWPEIKDREASSSLSPGIEGVYTNYNSKGTNQYTRVHLGTDITLQQKLDMLLKGLSVRADLSYNTDSYYSGGGYNYNGDYYRLQLIGDNDYEWIRYMGRAVNYYTPVAPAYYVGTTRYTGRSPFRSLTYSAQINYQNSFLDLHNVTALALVRRRESQSGANFQHYEENWVGRLTYDYDGKYLIEGNLGVSGSEQFAPGNRFGYFPAVAVGWNMAKEPFVKNLFPFMNNAKLRYSYGETGNDNTGSQWLYISEYTNWSNLTTGDTSSSKTVSTIKEGQVANTNARWERAKKNNIGIELGFLDNRYTVVVEFFNEKRDGILMSRRAVPDWFGQGIRSMNVGATKKHGYEIEIGYKQNFSDLFVWAKGNFNFNENRIVAIDEPALKPEYQKDEGKPIGQPSSQYNIGYYQDMDDMINYAVGSSTRRTIGSDMIYDFNGDGRIDSNDNLRLGYASQPNYTYSLAAGLTYKRFDFNFLIQGASNVSRGYGTYVDPIFVGYEGEVKYKGRDDVWTPDNRDAKYANWGGWNKGHLTRANAYYLRLKSMEVGYNLPTKWANYVGLSALRLYLQGSNLLTYAPNVKIGDPENQPSADALGSVSYFYVGESYPLPRRFTIGIKVDF